MPQQHMIPNYQSATSQCDDCRSIYNDNQLEEIDNFFMRVEAGGVVPSGQCPDPECGALCYPIRLQPGNQAKKHSQKSKSAKKKTTFDVITYSGKIAKSGFTSRRSALAYSRKCNDAQFRDSRSRDLRTTVIKHS